MARPSVGKYTPERRFCDVPNRPPPTKNRLRLAVSASRINNLQAKTANFKRFFVRQTGAGTEERSGISSASRRLGGGSYFPTTSTWKLSGITGGRPFLPSFGGGACPYSAASR